MSRATGRIAGGKNTQTCLLLAVGATFILNQYYQSTSIAALKKDVERLQARLDEVGMQEYRGKSSSSSGLPIQASPGDLVAPYLFLRSPPNRPSEAVEPELQDVRQGHYGGKGDKRHLGGFTQNDTQGQSPSLWLWMIEDLGVQSMVDVGCGRGISTKYFLDHGVDALCVEGSSDALTNSLLPRDRVVHHDFSLGPWWPAETLDVAWAVEVTEHIGRHLIRNYHPVFKRSALIFVTHSVWGGWHHVEVHKSWWWKARMEAQGFVYSSDLTRLARKLTQPSNFDGFNAQHLFYHLQVFINPAVASLPKHAHLIAGPGCWATDANIKCQEGSPSWNSNCYCAGPDELPPEFRSVLKGDTKYLQETLERRMKIESQLEEPKLMVCQNKECNY